MRITRAIIRIKAQNSKRKKEKWNFTNVIIYLTNYVLIYVIINYYRWGKDRVNGQKCDNKVVSTLKKKFDY